jgi:hypothetical protein
MADADPNLPSPPAETTTAPTRRWHEEGPRSLVGEPPRPKGRRVFLAVCLLLLFAGVIAGLLSWLAPVPRPVFLGLWVVDHQAPALPMLAFGDRDRQALLQGGYFPNALTGPPPSAEQHMLLRELSALQTRSSGESVVVYLGAYACRDARGRITVFSGNTDPDNPKTRLPLSEVLRLLAECPSRKKLLILDIMQPVADVRLGVLADDVASAIEQELAAVPDTHRLVLCACAPGQVSLGSEVAGRSLFGYYVEEGLRGWADGYGPDGSRDRFISVTELAAFVRARVDRWAQRNRNQRQTPVLYGTGNNFNLIALDREAPPTHNPALPPAAYPDWLKDAWKARDLALKDGTWRWAPRIMHQQEAWLIKAERDWRVGADPQMLQATHRAALVRLKAQAQRTTVLAYPDLHSLALTAALLEQPQADVGKVIQYYFGKLVAVPPADAAGRARILDEFNEKFAGLPAFQRGWAVLQLAAADNEPTAHKVRQWEALLFPQEDMRPAAVETLVLKRLYEMTAQRMMKDWPTAAVQRLLQVTQRGEKAASQVDTFSWNAPVLAEADRLRHDGEVLFWARGFGSLQEAEQLLARAGEKYDLVLRRADIVSKGRAQRDDALLLLPGYVPYLEQAPGLLSTWTAAVQAAQELGELLAGDTEPDPRLPRKIDGIQEKTDALKDLLTQLRQPFAAEQLSGLVRRSKLPRPDPEVLFEIDALLATPLPAADQRFALWQAGYDLRQRLHQQTVRLDHDEDEAQQKTEASEIPAPATAVLSELQRADRRAAAALALLEVAGLPTKQLETLHELQEKARKQREVVPWCVLGEAIAAAWGKQLPAQLQQPLSLPARDRLARLLPPFDTIAAVDELPLTLPTQMRHLEANDLWTYLGKHFRYLAADYRGADLDWSKDSSGERFFIQAALAYVPEPLPSDAVALSVLAKLPPLTARQVKLQVPVKLQWTAPDADTPDLPLSVHKPDGPWLTIDPRDTAVKGLPLNPAFPLTLAAQLPFDVRLLEAKGAARGRPPLGFVVQADLDGRHFHFKVPVAVQLEKEQPYLLVSTNPKEPDPVLSEIRLRPGKVQQSVYLYARNPGETARKVAIEIRGGTGAFKGGTLAATLPPQSTVRLNLAEPGPLPKGDLPPFRGPLQWRVLDPDAANAVLDAQEIPVVTLLPREYVNVTDIVFVPASADDAPDRNLLTVDLQVRSPPSGPDIPVELVLPPDRIPGLISAKTGKFKGELSTEAEKEPATLKLEVKNIQLDVGAEEDGVIYLNVDGYDRAFIYRTTFLRRGSPTTPRGDLKPALRIRCPRIVLANPKFAVDLEVDNPREGTTLEFAVGEKVAGDFRPYQPPKLVGEAKNRQIGFSPQSPDGGLVFEATVHDWSLPLDTKRLLGKHELRARLLDANGKEVARAYHTLVVDDSQPAGAQFVQPPAQAKRGSTVTVKATATSEVGIKDAQFFLGKPVDGKLPPNVALVPGQPIDQARTLWQTKLLLPEDKKGPIDVSAVFTSEVGLTSFATTTIELMDTDPAKTGPGRIRGRVLLGDLPQADLDVILRNDKKQELARVKTSKSGTFVFESVAPGKYTVYCRKTQNQRDGSAEAVVQANKDTEVTVSLGLRVTK